MGNLSHRLKAKNWRVKEYEKFTKKLVLIEDNEIKVKVNQKFGVEFTEPCGIDPNLKEEIPIYEEADKGIKFIERKSFYPYVEGTCGGSYHTIYVFKATKKGTFKIKFDKEEITVTAI